MSALRATAPRNSAWKSSWRLETGHLYSKSVCEREIKLVSGCQIKINSTFVSVRHGRRRAKGGGGGKKNETGLSPALFSFPSGRVSPFYSVAAGWRSKDRGRAGSKKKGTRGWRLRWGRNGATDTAKELHVTRKFVYTGVCASAAVMCTDAPRSILLQRRGFWNFIS